MWWLCLEAGISSLVDTHRCTSHYKTLPYNPSRYRELLCPGPQVSPLTSDTGTCTTEFVPEAYHRGGVLRTISTRPTPVHHEWYHTHMGCYASPYLFHRSGAHNILTKTKRYRKIELKQRLLEPKWHWSVRYCCNFLCAKHGYKQITRHPISILLANV